MISKILVIFLLTFTPINSIPCEENPNCDCSSNSLDEINIICNLKNNIGFDIIIKSRNNLKIICKNWRGWNDFYFRRYLNDTVLESLSFENCGLSRGISLKDLVKQFGVRGSKILKFNSYNNFDLFLTVDHFQGFEYVKKLDLSQKGLLIFPRRLLYVYPDLEYIDLSNNHIDLHNDSFHGTPNLKEINLASSGADVIHVATFNNLKNLEVLNIMSNSIYKIEAGIFNSLVSLKILNLADNKISELPLNIFHKLKQLEKLDISRNKFSFIPPKLFDENKELKELYLHNNFEKLNTLPDNLLANFSKLYQVCLNNNGFKYLPENLFWGSTSLKCIYLDNNSLDTLPKNIFRGLKNVTLLSIKNNKLETLPDKIFKDVENLKALDLSNNLIARVSCDLFYGLVSLEELNMERNQIKHIESSALDTLFNLRIAKFSHNPLSFPIHNRYLKELYLSNCSINHFFEDWSMGPSNLIILDLSHNFIKKVSAPSLVFQNRYLELRKISIDLRYNNITNFPLAQIENIERLSIENSYVKIYMNHNPISCDCSLYDLLRYNERKMPYSIYHSFNIVFGNLRCIQRDGSNEIEIRNLNSSTYLCSEHDYFKTSKRCQDGCTCSVRPSDQTRILDCSYKNMSQFLFDESKVNIQRNYPFIINFTGNSLTEIPSTKSLEPMNFTSFILSNNNISKITLDKLPRSLQVLDLHNNNISIIDSNVVDYLKSISLKKLTLSGNPILCICSNQNLIFYLQSHPVHNESQCCIKCSNTKVPINEIDANDLCVVYEYFTVFFTVILAILIFIISAVFYYRRQTIEWLKKITIVHFIRRDEE